MQQFPHRGVSHPAEVRPFTVGETQHSKPNWKQYKNWKNFVDLKSNVMTTDQKQAASIRGEGGLMLILYVTKVASVSRPSPAVSWGWSGTEASGRFGKSCTFALAHRATAQQPVATTIN